ncbi:hypothetical protein D3C73_1608240 [compost metagenome]
MIVVKSMWHQFWVNYNLALYPDCLDEEMKKKLILKIEYHQKQLSIADRVP